MPPRRINEIVQGKRATTADTAPRLGNFFGFEAQFWMNRQSHYGLKSRRSRLPEQGVPMCWVAPTEKDMVNETLEKRLWAVADQFRANSGRKAGQYSTPVLGLIDLRFAEVPRRRISVDTETWRLTLSDIEDGNVKVNIEALIQAGGLLRG